MVLGLGLATALLAEEAPDGNIGNTDGNTQVPTSSTRKASEPPAASSRSTAGPVSLKSLDAKLDQIAEQQERILKRLDEVMAELQIVKVRATIH